MRSVNKVLVLGHLGRDAGRALRQAVYPSQSSAWPPAGTGRTASPTNAATWRSAVTFNCPGQTLEELFAGGCHRGRCGPDAAELRAHAATSNDMAPNGAEHGHGQDDHLPGLHREQARGSAAPDAASARLVLLAAISRVRTEGGLEPIQRIHIGFQRSRSHPAVSCYGQTGELSRYLFQAELLEL